MKQTNLKKAIGFWDSVALVIGGTIGVGIFRTPSEICRYVSDPGWVLFAWILGGVIAFVGTLCFCELSAALPETGGMYVYLKRAYGPWAGFLFGWSEVALISAASIASISYAFGEYSRNLFPYPPGFEKAIAITMLWFLTLVNIAGIHYGKWLQNIVSIGKALALSSIIFLGLLLGKGSLGNFASSFPAPPVTQFLPQLGLAMVPILWTYGGWHESTYVAGEFKETDRELPLSLLVAASIIIFFYLVINTVYLYLFPAAQIATRKLIAGDVMDIIFGPWGKTAITGVILTCIFGVLNTVILVRGRVPFAVGKDHSIFRWFGTSHAKYETPDRSLLLNAVWASVLVLWGNFNQLLFLAAAAVWLFFAATGLAVFVIRKRFREKKRPFSAWGHPWTTLLFVAASLWIFFNTAIFSPRETAFGFSLIALGLPIYWLSRRMDAKRASLTR